MKFQVQLLKADRVVQELDRDIYGIAGCSLGFLMVGHPPQVLSVDERTPTATQGVMVDDGLVTIDGRDTCALSKEEVVALLRTAARLEFERADANLPGRCGESEAATSKAAVAGRAMSLPAASLPGQAPSPLAAALGLFRAAASLAQSPAAGASAAAAPGLGDGSYNKVASLPCNFAFSGGPFTRTPPARAKAPAMLVPPPTMASPMAPPSMSPPPAMASLVSGGAAAPGAPRIVLPPTLTGQETPAVDPGPQPEMLPLDSEREAWLELLRDGFAQQFRGANEWLEPPPFHRALHFAANVGEKVPEGKYPREALNLQLQLLFKARQVGPPDTADTGPPDAAAPAQAGSGVIAPGLLGKAAAPGPWPPAQAMFHR